MVELIESVSYVSAVGESQSRASWDTSLRHGDLLYRDRPINPRYWQHGGELESGVLRLSNTQDQGRGD